MQVRGEACSLVTGTAFVIVIHSTNKAAEKAYDLSQVLVTQIAAHYGPAETDFSL